MRLRTLLLGSASGPLGSRVDPATIKINGTTVDPAASYRVTVNSFLADGGDGFTELKNGSDIEGATNSVYVTPPLTLLDDGSVFSVAVSNPGGSVTSRGAQLRVNP
jgi:2',3'-cyclic-nucleotide 2'-phosphodiesterase (5'-nucleotidase family)